MAQELGCKYLIVGEDGTRAVLNDPTDADFVGFVDPSSWSGFDSPNVRVNKGERVAADAGWQGRNYRGDRTLTLGTILRSLDPAMRAAQDKWEGALSAYKADGVIRWTPTNQPIERAIWFRTENAARVSGLVQKTSVAQVSSKDWKVLSYALQQYGPTVGAVANNDVAVTNSGTIDAPVIFVVTGPANAGYTITNLVSGKKLTFAVALAAGQSRTIWAWEPDPGALILDGASVNADGDSDPINSDWTIAAPPGASTFRLTTAGFTAATGLTVKSSHAWRSG